MKDWELITAAANLCLDESLVWSDDFEQVRQVLGKWLLFEAGSSYALQDAPIWQAVELAKILTKDEHELA
jgi:hypothetical protein